MYRKRSAIDVIYDNLRMHFYTQCPLIISLICKVAHHVLYSINHTIFISAASYLIIAHFASWCWLLWRQSPSQYKDSISRYRYFHYEDQTASPTYLYNGNFYTGMMTSSNGNIFRVTGPLCGEFTGPGEIPSQRPVTRSFDVFFDLRLNKRLSKQPWGWWFETPSWSLWRHRNGKTPSLYWDSPREMTSCDNVKQIPQNKEAFYCNLYRFGYNTCTLAAKCMEYLKRTNKTTVFDILRCWKWLVYEPREISEK